MNNLQYYSMFRELLHKLFFTCFLKCYLCVIHYLCRKKASKVKENNNWAYYQEKRTFNNTPNLLLSHTIKKTKISGQSFGITAIIAFLHFLPLFISYFVIQFLQCKLSSRTPQSSPLPFDSFPLLSYVSPLVSFLLSFLEVFLYDSSEFPSLQKQEWRG